MNITARHKQACIDGPVGTYVAHPDAQVTSRAGWYQVMTPGFPSVSLNEISTSLVDEASVEELVESTTLDYSSRGLPLKWILNPLPASSRLGALLAPRADRHWWFRGMVVDTKLNVYATDTVECRRVDLSNVGDFTNVACEGWDYTASERDYFERKVQYALENPQRLAFWLAYDHGRPVGTAGIYYKNDHGLLVGGNVLAEARGRGIYRALIRARLEDLTQRDFQFAVTLAREATSAPILEKLGFETAYRAEVYLTETK